MNPEVLEKVLSCKALPTLPAVAMRVVELTQDRRVSIKDLAETIQNDQALTMKVLRTVNSSLYGLRTRCSSINQAIVMLGLSAVKTLALGFSLVTAIKDSTKGELDLGDHWRRALFTGIAARTIATRAKLEIAEECFLGGLLQDVGVVALHQALGPEYAAVVAKAAGDHRSLLRHEMADLEVQHSDIGAMLASRWRLPDELVMPIKYHERPTAAPQEFARVCRAVGLGNTAADVLTSAEPAAHLRTFYTRAERWFGLSSAEADEVLRTITAATREVAALLSVASSPVPNADEVLERARRQMESIEVHTGGAGGEFSAGDPEVVDELTGAATRSRFDQTLIAAFEQTRAGVGPLSLALLEVDQLKHISATCGSEAADAVLIAVAGRLRERLSGSKTLIGRYDEHRFGVIMPKTDRVTGVRLTEEARRAIASADVGLIAARHGSPDHLRVTVSIGVATLDAATSERFEEPADLTGVAEQAVAAAQRAGQNTVRVFASAAA